MPEIDLPDGVWDVAIAAKEAVRYTDHPDNYQAVYGMSSYALRAVIAAAWAAGRESAYTTDEWRAVFDAVDGPRNWFQPVDDETIAEKVLADCRKYYEDAYLQRRRAGATGWEKVADA